MDPSAKSEILRTSYSVSDKYFYYDPTRTDLTTASFSLNAGTHYYIELHHLNTGGSGYAKVAVEIANSPIANHQQSDKNVQKLYFQASNVKKDTFTISITNPDVAETFYVKIMD